MTSIDRLAWTWMAGRRGGAATAMAGLLLAVLPSRADVGVDLKLEHNKLLLHEPALAFIELFNDSDRPIVFGAGYETRADITLQVVRRNLEPVKRYDAEAEPLVMNAIAPGETGRMMVDLSRRFDMRSKDGYIVRCIVTWQGLAYESPRGYIDVVGGMPLKTVSRSVPGLPGHVRHFTLSYLARGGQETLFLSVEEEPSGFNYGVFALGPLVRVYDPVLEVNRYGLVTVVHQTRPNTYTRTLLQSEAETVRLLDQSYQNTGGGPPFQNRE